MSATLDDILKRAKPDQLAFYSVGCTWWCSDDEDLFTGPPLTIEYEGKTHTRSGVPRCPYCGSPLYQAPLASFLGEARMRAFQDVRREYEAAHHRNATDCYQLWQDVPLVEDE